jgi:uncharacterized protein YfaP (DUF2135 family)
MVANLPLPVIHPNFSNSKRQIRSDPQQRRKTAIYKTKKGTVPQKIKHVIIILLLL